MSHKEKCCVVSKTPLLVLAGILLQSVAPKGNPTFGGNFSPKGKV